MDLCILRGEITCFLEGLCRLVKEAHLIQGHAEVLEAFRTLPFAHVQLFHGQLFEPLPILYPDYLATSGLKFTVLHLHDLLLIDIASGIPSNTPTFPAFTFKHVSGVVLTRILTLIFFEFVATA